MGFDVVQEGREKKKVFRQVFRQMHILITKFIG